MKNQRNRSGRAGTNANTTTHTPFPFDHRPTLPVKTKGLLAQRTGSSANTTLDFLERDTLLGFEFQLRHPIPFPEIFGRIKASVGQTTAHFIS